MALFGKRREGVRAPAAGSASIPGRRLTTSLDLSAAEQMFRSVAASQGGYTEFGGASWQGPDAPAYVIAAHQAGRPALFMAAWDRGSHRELNIVPASNPAQLPQTLIGTWKMQDSSLSSTGTVTSFPVG